MDVIAEAAPGLPPQAIKSRDRVEPGSVNIPVGKWPKTAQSAPRDAALIAGQLVDTFNQALNTKNYQAISNLFLDDGYWRDHLALTWDLHTLKGRDKILSFLGDRCRLLKIDVDSSSAFRAPHFGSIDGTGDVKGIEFFVTLTTTLGAGQGVARLAEKDGQWKIFTLFTRLSELNQHEEAVGHRRTKGVEHGGKADRKNWLERRVADADFETREPAVVIIGMINPVPAS